MSELDKLIKKSSPPVRKVLQDGENYTIPEGCAGIVIVCKGASGTINGPNNPGKEALFTIKTTVPATALKFNTADGSNTHNITNLKGKVGTNMDIVGHYELNLLWNDDDSSYSEVF